MSEKYKPNELRITRVYNAPVQAVWDAWVDPEKVALWWGPRGFTITTKSKDVRPGGTWNYMMHGPDGKDWPNITLFHVVEKYSKLVYDHGANENQPPLFRVTVLFTESAGQTTMEMTMALATPEAAQEIKKFIKQAGGHATWDRLAEYLDKTMTGKEKFIINQTFDTPLKQMFKVWTDPEHFAKWLPPTGFYMNFIRADIRPGGSTFYEMSPVQTGQAPTMYGRAHYKEITAANRIVYSQEFCTREEKPARHPMAPIWPASLLTTVTFSAESEEQTRLTIEWEIDGVATSEEVNAFIEGRAGMTAGWSGSFDKLEKYLTEL